MTIIDGPPYNNRFNLPGLAVTSLAYASAAPVRSVGFCFAGASLTLHPQVNRALYGLNEALIREFKSEEK
jgi:hypothetical protein